MKAVSQRCLGDPDVLETVEVPRPAATPGHVLIELAATSVNPADCKLRAGAVAFLGEPPFILGFDVCGTVCEVGSAVTRLQRGDSVFGMVHTRTGTYSQYVLAPRGHPGRPSGEPGSPPGCRAAHRRLDRLAGLGGR